MAIKNFLNNYQELFSVLFRKQEKLKSKAQYSLRNEPKKFIAYLISRLFGPAPMLILLWLVTALKSGIGPLKALWVYPLILTVSLGLPLLLTTYLISIKKIKNIEWSDIEDRKKYFFPLAIGSSISLSLFSYLLTNPTTFHLSLLLCAIILTMAISYKYFNFKISGHIVIATVTFAGINLYYHQKFLWLFVLLIPIIWARHILKVHQLSEMIAGFIMPLLVTLVAILLFGYPAVH